MNTNNENVVIKKKRGRKTKIVIEEEETNMKKWVCEKCERNANECEISCQYCDGKMCRSCCNETYLDLDDEPTENEIPVSNINIELCGICLDEPDEPDEIKIQHKKWNDEHPYINRDDDAGECDDCGAKCELTDDRLCHYCYHHFNPNECWCVGDEEQKIECEKCKKILDLSNPDCLYEYDDDTGFYICNNCYDRDEEQLEQDGCPVCYEPTEYTTECGHKLCLGCYNNITYTYKFDCPICRCRMNKGVRLPKTDAEKIAEYDRLVAENIQLKNEIARLKEKKRNRRQNRDTPIVMVVDEDEPQIPTQPIQPARATTRVVLAEGQRLADLPFQARPRLNCDNEGCVRRTRRVCDGCGNMRACVEHKTCQYCRM